MPEIIQFNGTYTVNHAGPRGLSIQRRNFTKIKRRHVAVVRYFWKFESLKSGSRHIKIHITPDRKFCQVKKKDAAMCGKQNKKCGGGKQFKQCWCKGKLTKTKRNKFANNRGIQIELFLR